MSRTAQSMSALLLLAPLACTADGLSLTNRSPFLPPNHQSLEGSVQLQTTHVSDRYEVTGIYTIGENLFANIRNPETGESAWLQSDEPRNGLTLVTFNSESNTCTLRTADGQQLELAFVEAQQPQPSVSPQKLTDFRQPVKPDPAITVSNRPLKPDRDRQIMTAQLDGPGSLARMAAKQGNATRSRLVQKGPNGAFPADSNLRPLQPTERNHDVPVYVNPRVRNRLSND